MESSSSKDHITNVKDRQPDRTRTGITCPRSARAVDSFSSERNQSKPQRSRSVDSFSSSSFTADEEAEIEAERRDEIWNKAEAEGRISDVQVKARAAIRRKLSLSQHDKDKLKHKARKMKDAVIANLKERAKRFMNRGKTLVSSESVATSSSSTRIPSRSAPIGTLEVFCGSAKLSAELKKQGFHAVGIDWAGNKDTPMAQVVRMDCTDPSSFHTILRIVKENNIAYVHFAPPCGTASREQGRSEEKQDQTPSLSDQTSSQRESKACKALTQSE